MITKIADHNDKLYDALFEEISSALGGSPIRTLEEYFGRLESIGEYVSNHLDKSYFLRLPVDEDMVMIDANARTITLPENYRKNGIAVVGDTFAETLWFKVDRYYDLQDLSLTNIYIFWELPDKTKGYSQPAFKDINSEAGQLIFSWTIPSLLTETAGNVKFYVSFQKTDNTYVFNTIPQLAKINDTLDAKVDSDGIQYDDVGLQEILDRLHNTTNIGAIVVSRPRISSLTSSEDVTILSEDKPTANIDVYAYSSDNGVTLTYILYKNGESSGLTATVIRERTKDTIADPHKTYYSAEVGDDILDNTTDLSNAYEEGKRFVITEKGSYQCQVIATRTIELENGDSATSTSAPAYTYRWVWEEPTPFTLKEDSAVFKNNKYGIITSATDNDKTIVITWPKDSKDSPQQQSAIYGAEVSIEPIEGAKSISPITYTSNGNSTSEITIENPFLTDSVLPELVVGTSTVIIKFNKNLNKTTIPENDKRPQIQLNIQSEAKSYNANGITIEPKLVPVNGNINVSISTDDLIPVQTYYYCWQRQTGGNWNDATNLTQITNLSSPNFTANLSQSGTYRIKLITKFGNDTKEVYSSAADQIVTIYSVSN